MKPVTLSGTETNTSIKKKGNIKRSPFSNNLLNQLYNKENIYEIFKYKNLDYFTNHNFINHDFNLNFGQRSVSCDIKYLFN